MRSHPIFVAVLLLVGNAAYSGYCIAEVPLPSYVQSIHGSPNSTQNIQNGNGNTINIYRGNIVVAKNNSFQAKQEALLVAQNPTTLQITNLHWMSWFGDSKPFLTAELANVSNLPAQNIQVSILNNKTGATINSLKPYTLSKSYTLKVIGTPIGLPAQSKMELPIASQSDIESIIKSDCITGAGLEFQPLRAMDLVNGVEGTSSNRESSLLLKVSYTTIFRQHVSFTRWVVIDSAIRQNDFMVPRGSNKPVPLKCIGDPFWDTVIHIGND